MRPKPQFSAELRFHFNEHAPFDRERRFVFGDDLHRRVPLAMESVEGLHTVGLWMRGPATFYPGDSAVVDCVLLTPEIFASAVKRGVGFELWDRGFFATGTVLERFDSAWPKTLKN